MSIFLLTFVALFSFFSSAPLTFCWHFDSQRSAVEVELDNLGKLRGFSHRLEQKSGETIAFGSHGTLAIAVFLGIPFARPPVGPKLRFEKPQPVPKWKGVLKADKQKSACIYHARPDGLASGKKSYSEDCLYLNVFAPLGHQPSERIRHPVLVVIHGGGFELGSTHPFNNYTDLGQKFVSQGIVVVTMEYRLGWIGFGSTGDEEMPGNLGLWDQLAALKFVRSHIHAFGGDPEQVTLYGYSAGSASVSLLGISPHSRDLFKQGIQMSGSPFAAWALNERTVNETVALARELGCFNRNNAERNGIKECLGGREVAEIWSAVDRIGPTRYDDANFSKWCPRVDGDFLPADIAELTRNAKPKPAIIGFVDLESLLWTLFTGTNNTLAAYAIPWSELRKYDRAQFAQSVRMLVAKPEFFGMQQIARKLQEEIVGYYLGEDDPLDEFDRLHGLRFPDYFLQRYTQLLSDLQFIVPILMELQLKAVQFGWPNIYLYENVHYNRAEFPKPVKVHQNFHTNDENLLFSESHFPFDFGLSSGDLLVQKHLVQMVVNFVKTGNPSSNSLKWLPVFEQRPTQHLRITATPRMKQELDQDILGRFAFWQHIVQKYGQLWCPVREMPLPGMPA